MPAIAPYYVHAAGAGILMADVGLRGDEDFLLIHSVTDEAEYSQEIKRFNAEGKKIYHVIQDPYLNFKFDCDCLAFQGLANGHPGQAVTLADIQNYLPGAFGWPTTGVICHYRRPVRHRGAGALASLNFELHVELGNTTITVPAALSASTWGDPAEILVGGETTPGDFPEMPSIFGATLFWRREMVMDDRQTGENYESDDTTSYFQAVLTGDDQPADLAEFLADVDAYGNSTESTIVEVYHVPTAEYWVGGTSGRTAITELLIANIDPREATVTQDATQLTARYYAYWSSPAAPVGLGNYTSTHREDYADLDAFLDANNGGVVDGPERELMVLFDTKTNAYLYPVPP